MPYGGHPVPPIRPRDGVGPNRRRRGRLVLLLLCGRGVSGRLEGEERAPDADVRHAVRRPVADRGHSGRGQQVVRLEGRPHGAHDHGGRHAGEVVEGGPRRRVPCGGGHHPHRRHGRAREGLAPRGRRHQLDGDQGRPPQQQHARVGPACAHGHPCRRGGHGRAPRVDVGGQHRGPQGAHRRLPRGLDALLAVRRAVWRRRDRWRRRRGADVECHQGRRSAHGRVQGGAPRRCPRPPLRGPVEAGLQRGRRRRHQVLEILHGAAGGRRQRPRRAQGDDLLAAGRGLRHGPGSRHLAERRDGRRALRLVVQGQRVHQDG
mmetsp:Transcript_4928/g.13983  ORF Transcript_4928/g.13983 Transcript_4928/m.13983 type:complete len:318 (+) Transcript_4928:361-1314(+)